MLVLASASPRRHELLQNAGIPFVVRPANVPEVPQEGEQPESFVERMAREKALAVSRQSSDEFVLGADTIVVIDAQILGKPRDVSDAARMLRLLSGRTHRVITGICLIGPDLRSKNPKAVFEDTRSQTTLVRMRVLGDDDVRDYVSTAEPMDKAGAYAIQGIASRWISGIEGDYFNVVGLPVAVVYEMLREHGAA